MGEEVIFKPNCQKVRITFPVNNSALYLLEVFTGYPTAKERPPGIPQVPAPAAPTDKLHPIPHTLLGPEATQAPRAHLMQGPGLSPVSPVTI